MYSLCIGSCTAQRRSCNGYQVCVVADAEEVSNRIIRLTKIRTWCPYVVNACYGTCDVYIGMHCHRISKADRGIVYACVHIYRNNIYTFRSRHGTGYSVSNGKYHIINTTCRISMYRAGSSFGTAIAEAPEICSAITYRCVSKCNRNAQANCILV